MSDEVIKRVAAELRAAYHSAGTFEEYATAALSALRAGDTLPNGLVVERDWRYPEDTYIDARNPAKER